jgi:hypothetical protein
VIRSTTAEKEFQIAQVEALYGRFPEQAAAQLRALQETAVCNQNHVHSADGGGEGLFAGADYSGALRGGWAVPAEYVN